MFWFICLLLMESGILTNCFDTTSAQNGCSSFTTKVSREGEDEMTVRFSLPHNCWTTLGIQIILVKRRIGAGPPSTLCQIMNDTRHGTSKSTCRFDSNTEEYLFDVRKRDRAKSGLTESLEFRAESYNSSFLVLTTLQLSWEYIQSTSISTTDSELTSKLSNETKTSTHSWVSDYAWQEYTVFLTTAIDHQSTFLSEGTSEAESLRNDNQPSQVSTSFTQSPAFGIIVILAFVGIIIVLIVIWIKQKRISWLRLTRRSRKYFSRSNTYDEMFRRDTVTARPTSGLGMGAGDTYDMLPHHNTAASANLDVLDTVHCPPTPRSYEFRAVSVQVNRDSLLCPIYAAVNGERRQALDSQSPTPMTQDDENLYYT